MNYAVEPPVQRRRQRAWATLTIIVINVAVYVLTSYENFLTQITDEWMYKLAFIPALIQEPSQWYRIFISMFAHADILHILFNMWALYIFGPSVERRIGSGKYLVLYLVSGVVATIFHTAFIPVLGGINVIVPAIGASGAISGVLGAYLLLFPYRPLTMCYFMFLIPLCFTSSASWFLIFWFATQVIYGYLRFGGVAFFAHVGGFIGGLTLIYFLAKRREPLSPFSLWEYRPGLEQRAKAVLAILLVSVISGAMYSMLIADSMSGVYVYNVSVKVGGQVIEDQGAYTIDGNYVPPSTNEARIVLNRIVWSGLIHNTYSYETNTPVKILYRDTILAQGCANRIRIFVDVNGVGVYDSRNILKWFNGTIVTDIINMTSSFYGYTICSILERNVLFYAEISGEDVSIPIAREVIPPFASIAAILTIIALLVVIYKDRELAEPLPWIFTPGFTSWWA
jgi:hypothetical protein